MAGAWTQEGVAVQLQQRVLELVDSPSWEGRQGGFLAAKVCPFALQSRHPADRWACRALAGRCP
jgi:hypothetical protein